MKLFRNIWAGLKQGFHYRRIAGYIFLIQLFLATMIGLLAYHYIQYSIGHTTQLLKVIDGYDHDVLQDLLLFESTGWWMIKVFSLVVVGLYLLIGPFIMGGLLLAFQQGQDRWEVFWRGGSRFYFSFFKLNLIVLTFLLLVLGILATAGVFLTVYGLVNFLTELPILYGIVGLSVLFLFFGILLISSSIRAKWLILNNEIKAWKAFKLGFKEVRQSLIYYLLLSLLFLSLTIGFAVLINYLINSISESRLLLVLLALLLQVFALFVRVCLRNSFYASLIKD